MRSLFSNSWSNIKFWVWQNLLSLDQFCNTLLGGMADETLSSRAYRAEVKGRVFGMIFRPMIDTLFFFDPEHCFNSYVSELNRRHLPREFSKL